jgi:cation:H+ antiporter
MIWLEFLAAALVVMAAGTAIVRFADTIAQETGLGRAWAGVLLLATATSLPELATGVSAVRVAEAPDLAAGGAFGSNVFNVMLIGALGLHPRWRGLLCAPMAEGLKLAISGAALITAGGVMLLLALPLVGFAGPWLTWLPLLLLAGYIAVTHWTFGREGGLGRIDPVQLALRMTRRVRMVRGAVVRPFIAYLIGAAVVVAGGVWLARTAEEIAVQMQWSESFVGSLFLAIATSLPELAVGVAALRAGRMEMALSNLLGSNVFNMGVVLPAEALAFGARPFFREVSSVHLIAAAAAVVMTGLVTWTSGPRCAAEASEAHWTTYLRAAAIIGLFGLSAYLTFALA